MKPKQFELLDFAKFSRPTLSDVQPVLTALSLAERLGDKSFMSYSAIWPKVERIVQFGASEKYLKEHFSFYAKEWKNKSLQDVARMIGTLIGGKGVWYKQSPKASWVSGFLFKASIKGIWFFEGSSYAVLINPRKGQRLTMDDRLFLARGIYELHCIDDPNDPIPMIIDLSAPLGVAERKPSVYVIPENEAMPLVAFEHNLHQFVDALAILGMAQPIDETADAVDLFKRGR